MIRNVKPWLALLLAMVSTAAFPQASPGGNTYTSLPFSVTAPSNNQCLVYQSSTNAWVNGSCSAGSGATVTGTPATGNLTFFSGAGSISNGNLSGDCTTSGTGVLTCTKTNGTSFGTLATANAATPPAIGGTTPAAGTFTTANATTFDATSLSAPFQINGTTFLAFPQDGTTEYQTFVGFNAGVNAAIAETSLIATCVGSHTCGSSGVGMTGKENTALGWNDLAAITTGGFNTAAGVNAMGTETTGSGNVAVGEDDQRDTLGNSDTTSVGANADRNMIATNSVFVGFYAGSGGTGTTISSGTLSNDVGVGYQALYSQLTSTGGNNTAIGAGSMQSPLATTDHDNVAIGLNTIGSVSMTTATFETAAGSGALQADVSGTNNVALGALSLNSLTTSTGDVSIGANAMKSNTAGNNSVAIGLTAMENSTGDTTSIAIGDQAMLGQSTSAGNEDIAIGFNALGGTGRTTAIDNITIGDRTLQACTVCSNLTVVGYHAGEVMVNGTNSVIIGNGVASTTLTGGNNDILIGTTNAVDGATATASNEINIQNILFYNSNSTAAPAVSACGTSPSIDSHANNRSGTVTVGTGTDTSCTVTFAGTGYSTWNHCRVTAEQSDAGFAYSYTKTVITVTATSLTSEVFDYDCDGY